MKAYLKSDGGFVIGLNHVSRNTPVELLYSTDDLRIRISPVNGSHYYYGPVNELTDESGTPYANRAAFETATKDFFFRVGIDPNDTILAYSKIEIDALPIKDRFLEGLQLLGSAIKAIPYGIDLYSFFNGTMTLVDGDVQQVVFKIDKETVVAGVGFISNVQGVFTADNENAIALYSVVAGVYTQVAKTENSGAIWKAAAGAKVETAFASPVTLQPGIYVAALLYNNSAQTTAPKIYMHSTSNLRAALVLGNSMQLSGKIAVQTVLPTTTTGGTFVFDTNVAGLYLY